MRFTPGGRGHDPQFSQKLPIRVSNNSKAVVFSCVGSSYTLGVQFDPPIIDLGAILPKHDKQQPISATLNMLNPNDHPIEVVSLDWDKRYLEEERLLREYSGYNSDDVILREPRGPGMPLWQDISLPAVQGTPSPGPPGDNIPAVGGLGAPGEASPAANSGRPPSRQTPVKPSSPGGKPLSAGSDGVSALQHRSSGEWPPAVPASGRLSHLSMGSRASVLTPPELPKAPLYVILLGDPLSGKSTQASLLSKRYRVPAVTVDALLLVSSPSESF